MPLDPGVTNALEGEATIAEAPAKVPRQAVIPPGRAKARIPRLCPRFDPAEEGSKGPIESEKWVPHRRTAHPVRPHTCSPNVRQLTKLFVKGHRTAQHSPGVATLLECRIVELAREAKLGFEGEALADSGINPIAIRPSKPRLVGHASIMMQVVCDSCLSNRPRLRGVTRFNAKRSFPRVPSRLRQPAGWTSDPHSGK